MVIGEPGVEIGGKGYAHVYERESKDAPWVYKQQLQSEYGSSDNFGYWIRIHGNTIVGKSFLSLFSILLTLTTHLISAHS
jgi:hypothetical protein